MVDLRLLGSMEVDDGAGRVVKVGGPRQKGLIALLALSAPKSVATDTILDALWGDAEIARPEAALHMTVSRVRTAIGGDHLVTEDSGYRLDIPSSNSDVARFRALVRRGRQLQTLGHPMKAAESLRHALAQWRGPALVDVREFEFAEAAARSLEDERLAAVEFLMESMLGAGEHEHVVGELFGLTESFPYRERLWELLMLALYRSGRQAEALAAFNDLRTRLGTELGLEPTPELADLEERILLHDPALAQYAPAPSQDSGVVEYQQFAAGDLIVEQGEAASTVYWIEEGRVEILKSTSAGKLHKLAELGAGDYFGELAATLGTRRTATVRAILPTSVSVHDLRSFRNKLGMERRTDDHRRSDPETLRTLIRSGEYLEAFDMGARLIERGEMNPEIRYLAVLALARSGATVQARKRHEQYGLASIDPDSLTPELANEIGVLGARLDKDVALRQSSAEGRSSWAERAAAGYAAAYERSRSPYHAVNAATMTLMSGRVEAAEVLASEVVQLEGAQGDGYWDAVTAAEAALVLGDESSAGASLQRAADASVGMFSARATTTKQLKLVCSLKDIDTSILEVLRNPTVVHYCGHRILRAGQSGRFPAPEEERVRAELAASLDELDAGFGFGSLAAGADILAAEALLERGAELHVTLPFSRDEFVRTSVVSAGEDWVRRFDRCLASATSVEIVSSGEYLNDPVMFDYCARVAMGDALLRADRLESRAHQLAVWDGIETGGSAGTAVDIETWRTAGHPGSVISVESGNPGETPTPTTELRQIRSIVFGDFAGFSRLSDAQLITFQQTVMQGLSEYLEPYRESILSGRTWGDGVYLVLEDVAGAAECALDVAAAVAEMDFEAMGLSQLRGLRVAAHAAPVFDGWDPITGNRVFYGAGVTQAARIEPRTPEGEIYTTHAFAALAMLSSASAFECQYVGTLPTAKHYGELPLYALRRR